jgi:dGTPase
MLRLRHVLLERQDGFLAGYATRESQTRGRFFLESESEYRTPFQKDRDRILHTTAFRRLEYKTQVFVNHEGDYYRTRLTHTLEVAQVGRSLAVVLGANETLVEVLALSHDLGHPPFGHAGEDALDALMQQHHAGGFDHNQQSYRIVSELERRYADFEGLNLCWESLEGMVKHHPERPNLAPYAAVFEPHLRPSLEAQISAIADGTAYNAHDLDDGLKSGILNPEGLADLPIWQELWQRCGFAPLRAGSWNELMRRQIIRELLGLSIQDLLLETERRLTRHHIDSAPAVRHCPEVLVTHSPEILEQMAQLKAFLYQHLYDHPSKIRQTHRAQHFVEGLFKAYLERPKLLPLEVQKKIPQLGLERTCCDYIAGMTDRFAADEFARLYSPLER